MFMFEKSENAQGSRKGSAAECRAEWSVEVANI